MKLYNPSSIVVLFALALLLGGAQLGNFAAPRYYELSSGEYIECCGIAGEKHIPLPNSMQRFVKLNTNAQSQIASMSILGDDMQTVFSISPLCPPQGPIQFTFDGGLVFSDRIIFHVDPAPSGLYWNYTVSNSPGSLIINGVVGFARTTCADVPDKFTHTNVIASLITPPDIGVSVYSQDGTVLVVHGRAGWQTVVEASSDLIAWEEIARDIMPATVCAACPQWEVRDTGSNGNTPRFYRAYQRPQ